MDNLLCYNVKMSSISNYTVLLHYPQLEMMPIYASINAKTGVIMFGNMTVCTNTTLRDLINSGVIKFADAMHEVFGKIESSDCKNDK